ncbi:Thioredoxin [Candidatus Hodgkinia cicadicola]|nr:Thioredoxin [Candidatus Hodgkinia cicadicola]
MLELRNLKRVLESKVSGLSLILLSWCWVRVNSISLALNVLPSVFEWKLGLLRFDAHICLLFFCFKAMARWGMKLGALTAARILSEWLVPKIE